MTKMIDSSITLHYKASFIQGSQNNSETIKTQYPSDASVMPGLQMFNWMHREVKLRF